MSIKDLFTKQDQTQQSKVKPVTAKSANVPAKKSESAGEVAMSKKIAAMSHRVLIKPLVTEKGAKQTEQNKYFFMVAPQANKVMIKQAMMETYGIKPQTVNILQVKGKKVKFGRREGMRKDWKKAIITLPAGKSIDVYKGV